MSTNNRKNIFLGVKHGRRVKLTSQLSASRLSRQQRILSISQPYRPPRHVTRIALLFTFLSFSVIGSNSLKHICLRVHLLMLDLVALRSFGARWIFCVTCTCIIPLYNCLLLLGQRNAEQGDPPSSDALSSNCVSMHCW
jgi:hypothetical protein